MLRRRRAASCSYCTNCLPELSEWAVHPGLGDTASPEIDNGWRVRHSDLEFLISPEARDAVRQEGIVIIDYRAIKDTWSQQWPHEQAAR
jgi:chitin disaccharide deacetylase